MQEKFALAEKLKANCFCQRLLAEDSNLEPSGSRFKSCRGTFFMHHIVITVSVTRWWTVVDKAYCTEYAQA
jgi:hypothetical protein